jgi:hypothetical protein
VGRTLTFGSLIISQAFLIFFSREWAQVKANRLLLYISTFTIIFLLFCVYIPVLQQVFNLVALEMKELALMLLLPFLMTMFLKIFRLEKYQHK